jgi:cell fate (sporulation/competence/biofilm development) regulator YmcA (YheA/YmcA/DUF963 family)
LNIRQYFFTFLPGPDFLRSPKVRKLSYVKIYKRINHKINEIQRITEKSGKKEQGRHYMQSRAMKYGLIQEAIYIAD